MSKKKTLDLNHEGVDYINSQGREATADFREIDGKEAFLASQENNAPAGAASGKPVARVFRTSSEGEALLARFYDRLTGVADAQKFANIMNENYSALSRTTGARKFYTAVVRVA